MRSRTFPTSDAQVEQSRLTSHFSFLTSSVLANPWLVAALIFVFTRAVAVAGAYSGVSGLIAAEPERNKGWLAELGLMWDAAHYAGIASDFYQYDPGSPGGTNVAFAPLYPFLMRALGSVLQWGTFGWDWGHPKWGALIAAGIIISNVSFFLAVALLIKLLVPRLGNSGAALVALGLASLPTGFFFSAVYTEGLFVLLVVGSFVAARSDRRWKWLGVGLIGMLASLDRFAGMLLLPVMVVEYLAQKGWNLRRLRADVGWLLLIPAGVGIYAAFLWIKFGSPFVVNDSMQKGWNHQGSFFLVTYWESLSQLWMSLIGTFPAGQDPVLYYGQGSRLYLVLDLALPVLFLGGAWVARKKLVASEWMWLAMGIVYPLSTNITLSMARYVLPLWSGLVWLGIEGRGRRVVAAIWIAVSLALMAWCSRIYGSAQWIG